MTPPTDSVAYPRAGLGGPGGSYRRPPGAYFDFIGIAWDVIRRDLGTWVACTLIYLVISYAISIPFSLLTLGVSIGDRAPSVGSVVAQMVLNIVSGVISYFVTAPMMVGMGLMGRRAAYGMPIAFGDAFAPYRRIGAVGGSAVVAYFALIFGLLLCIVPGVFAGGLLTLAPFFAADGESVGDALPSSGRECRPFFLPLFFLFVAAAFVSGLGALLCGIGILLTFPILPIVLGLTYDTIRPLNVPPAPISTYGYGAPPA